MFRQVLCLRHAPPLETRPTMRKGKHRTTTRTARYVATTSLGLTGLALTPGIAHAAPQEAWDAVALCESGGQNIESASPASTASGYFQIIDGTWAAYGGLEYAPRAIDATYEQQLTVAERILAGQGPSAWVNGCGEPLVAPEPPPPTAATTTEYVVQPGDTLAKLGRTFGIPWQDIASANGILDPWVIHIEQVLQIPAPEAPTEEIYVVQPGDTMSQIAIAQDVCLDDLFEDNRDVVEDVDLIFPGEELVVHRIVGPLPPVPGAPVENTYTVQPGDTLGRLFGTGWESVAIRNGITSPFVIYPGQVLEIGGAVPSPAGALVVRPVPGSGGDDIGAGRGHEGLDLACEIGDPVVAALAGTVDATRTFDGGSPYTGYGLVADVIGTDGARYRYAHLSRVDVVPGQPVVAGQQIGACGNTGGVQAGPGGDGSHLHFERRPSGELYGAPDSPSRWLAANGA